MSALPVDVRYQPSPESTSINILGMMTTMMMLATTMMRILLEDVRVKDLIIILSNIFYNDHIIFIIKILYWLDVCHFSVSKTEQS